jgi:hypothetical protein
LVARTAHCARLSATLAAVKVQRPRGWREALRRLTKA